MAEFKVSVARPGEISFNYEELKAEVSAKASEYASYVYTPETIGDAKTDRAKLNKLKTALNDERVKREREFMLPFMEFKSQVADLIQIIDKPIKAIDTQVKEFEAAEKEQKKLECIELFNLYRVRSDFPKWLAYEQIENTKWYNKTSKKSEVNEEIAGAIQKVNSELDMIQNYCPNPSVGIANYKKTLDLKKSLELGRMAAEEEQPKVVTNVVLPAEAEEEEPEWVLFKAYLTPSMARALNHFCKLNGIKLRKHEEA